MSDKSVLCPVCKKSFTASGSFAKCPVCGYTAEVDVIAERNSQKKAETDVAVYRLMASADAFFARKSYDEAYINYNSALEANHDLLKAEFRRELTSQYLMLESSSVYLSCAGFFSKLDNYRERLSKLDSWDEENVRIKLTFCRDLIDYISVRSEYEKKYASSHKNEKTVEVYMSNVILLFEYSANIIKYVSSISADKFRKELAYLIIDGCDLGLKLKGMLSAGAEYVETSAKMDDLSGEQTARNVSRIKRRMLSQDESMRIEVVAADMQKAKQNVFDNAEPALYSELKKLNAKKEESTARVIQDEDSKRAEYELWRQRNEKEYVAADKKIIIFGISEKAAWLFAVVMFVMFAIELVAFNSSIDGILITSVVFAVLGIAFGLLKKAAIKKKSFYAKVIEGDSANIRSSGGFGG